MHIFVLALYVWMLAEARRGHWSSAAGVVNLLILMVGSKLGTFWKSSKHPTSESSPGPPHIFSKDSYAALLLGGLAALPVLIEVVLSEDL